MMMQTLRFLQDPTCWASLVSLDPDCPPMSTLMPSMGGENGEGTGSGIRCVG